MKTLKIILIAFLCGFLPFACTCSDPPRYHENIDGIKIGVLNREFFPADTIKGDTLIVQLKLSTIPAATVQNPRFCSAAYASTCNEDYSLGLVIAIDSIVVSSDSAFNGVKAHQSLNGLVAVGFRYAIHDPISSDYQTVIKELNRNPDLAVYFSMLKPAGLSLKQDFIISVYTQSGKVFSAATDPVNWE